MKINFIPIDNRPVTYDLSSDIALIDKSLNLTMPEKSYLGGLLDKADENSILDWLKNEPVSDLIILSLDTIAYGGLVSSRRSNETLFDIEKKLKVLKEILLSKKKQNKNIKILATSSIMRISNNNENEEEKEYWNKWGKKIFEYSYFFHKNSTPIETDIPKEILEDYLQTRKRNFEVNKIYLNWLDDGILDYLIYSKDDTGEFGLNVKESKYFEEKLKNKNGEVKTGADEIPLGLLLRGVISDKKIKVNPVFNFENSKNLISKYEDVSIEKSVLGQISLASLEVDKKNPDIILFINNFEKIQGDFVFQDVINSFKNEIPNFEKPFIIADVNNANGADTGFIEKLFSNPMSSDFLAYSGYNTSANSIGSALCIGVITYLAKKSGTFVEDNYKKLMITRFLDDWAYQSNLRINVQGNFSIQGFKNLDFKPFEDRVKKFIGKDFRASYFSPWDRSFEIGIKIEIGGI